MTVDWRSIRADLVSKRFAFLGKYPPCPWYSQLDDDFVQLMNVTPEEQEHFMNDEVRMFLAGYETENIRFTYGSDTDAPVGIKVNPSLDPFMRSAVERFKKIFIDIWCVRVYGYALKHDYSFSLTTRAVAEEIMKRLNKLVSPIIEAEAYDLADFGLNTLSRSVATVQSSIKVYANVVAALKKDCLIGGQVLTLLYNMRMRAVVEKEIQDLQEIFEVAWKMFAKRVGAWVEQGWLHDSELEFIIWPTSSLSASITRKILTDATVKLDSSDYVLIQDLCPAFLLDLLPSIAKCGDYNNMMDKAHMSEGKMSTDWSKLDVTGLQRKVQELEREKSSVVLKQLCASISFDESIRDTMALLLEGVDIDILSMTSKKESILNRPMEEVSKQQLRRVSESFTKGLARKFPFVTNFKLCSSDKCVFEDLRNSGLVNDAPAEPLEQETETLFVDLLSLTYNPPSKIEKLIPIHVVKMYTLVFRVALLLNTAIIYLSEAIFEVGLLRNPDNIGRAYILSALYRNVIDLTVSLTNAVARAVTNFTSEMSKAESIDCALKLQKEVVFQIFADSGLNKWRKVSYLKRLMDLVIRLGVTGLLKSETLAGDYYIILEAVESMQLVE
ncbi:hypothetical protein V3C99_014348 [Haemonchus contortus]|uniref:Gamma-tubulin complex component n=1 Tax=Haemonchus contortus TaxID=6289 RepID=A0A7I4YUZ9_HAECO|nr:Spc97 Spc98 domain containing protein [Haemonchus contortus]